MYLLTFIGGAIIGGTLAIFFHCLVILGKECDSRWEEEMTITKEEKKED